MQKLHSRTRDPRLQVSTYSSKRRPHLGHPEPPRRELLDVPPTRASSHKRYLTIATMMKNQRPWLREWIEFYTMMGVEHFIVYDNGSEDLPLEILQPYIDKGGVTYIPWPPTSVPHPPIFKTRLDRWQYLWFRDALDTCLEDKLAVHQDVPCKLAAYADAVRRTKNGVSRWLGILDIDDYVFPLLESDCDMISTLLWSIHDDDDHVQIYGRTFGTGGRVHHAARRQEGDPLPALLTESYIHREPLHRTS
jgi:hypothetical protein